MATKQTAPVISQQIAFLKSSKNYHVYVYGDKFSLYIPRSAFPGPVPAVLNMVVTTP